MSRPSLVLTVVAAAVLLLAGCTDIPSTSAPQQVESIPPANGVQPSLAPPAKGLSPRVVVQSFLDANAASDPGHEAARQYLTKEARQKWRDTTVTVLSSDVGIGNYANGTVSVIGGEVGTLDAHGVYTPLRQGTGDGGPPVKLQFKLQLENGQWRISSVPTGVGVLLGADTFESVYRAYPLYFYDQTGTYLVPDLRRTQLLGHDLETWLLDELALGPRTALTQATDTDTFPPVPANSTARVSVRDGDPVRIDVPGAAQLEPAVQYRLAAQIAFTLDGPLLRDTVMAVTDGNQTLSIRGVGTSFLAGQFTNVERPAPAPDVYYVQDGRVVNARGDVVPGAVANGPDLQTVAVARRTLTRGTPVLCVAGIGRDGVLYTGTAANGLRATAVGATTSRPTWAPGLAEVWVASGKTLWRVPVGSSKNPPQSVDVSVLNSEQILAARFSPEGSRLALVLRKADGSTELGVASVVRMAGAVRVEQYEALSPLGVGVVDVAWIDSTRLYATGSLVSNGEPRIFEVDVDGSVWQPHGIASLPDGPDYVTVVSGNIAWVSVSGNGTVWEQSGTGWASPDAKVNDTLGDAPVYLE